MKRLILPILLLCLLLWGCGETPNQEDHPHEDTRAATPPTEPDGSYDPDSRIEELTGGAVRAYPMDIPDTYAFAVMGEDVLVFSGTETTTLTRLSGENLFATATRQLDVWISPDSPNVQVTEKGAVYYSPETFELVALDTTLTETERIEVPEDLVGVPVLSGDRNYVYYCTATALRCLDLEKGISRLVKEISNPEQSVAGVLLDDTVVCCALGDENGSSMLFCSAENGQTLYSGGGLTLTTWEDSYFAVIGGDLMHSFVYGSAAEAPQMIIPTQFDAPGWYLESQGWFVSAYLDESDVTLEGYDLSSGRRFSQVTIPDSGYPRYIEARNADDQLYALCQDASGEGLTLCRWDMNASHVEDETVYTSAYYHADSPDTEGLAQCRALAEEIGSRHGVRILLGDEAVAAEPWDYDLTAEYQVPVLKRELEILDTLLASYPDGFLAAAAEGTNGGVITVCLVRDITGSPESGDLGTADGLQFRYDNGIYVALAAGGEMERNLYHALYYAIETRLLSNSNDCYEWDKLNPSKFKYDYDPAVNAQRAEDLYLEGEKRYFIDTESMYSPSEDRARIMMYAMMEGNEEYFRSEYMQKKLYTLCTGIREAFGMKKFQESFLWEQYLDISLAYKE